MKSKLNKNGTEEREAGKRERENSLMNCKWHVKASVQWRSRKKSKTQNSGSS